jgi:topoisomerase-4 subunit A
VIYRDGTYEHTNFDLTNHYEADQVLFIHKYKNTKPITALYYNDKDKYYYVKRFMIETLTQNKKFPFIPEGDKNRVVMATDQRDPIIVMERGGGKKKETNTEDTINLSEFIEVKGAKAIGNRIAGKEFVSVVLLPPDPDTEMEEEVQEALAGNPNPQQTLLVNEDLLKEEQEKIKRLLADDPETEKREKPKQKLKPTGGDQPKLF